MTKVGDGAYPRHPPPPESSSDNHSVSLPSSIADALSPVRRRHGIFNSSSSAHAMYSFTFFVFRVGVGVHQSRHDLPTQSPTCYDVRPLP